MDYKEKVIALLNSKELAKEQREKLKEIFPELAESDDERIRKAIHIYLDWLDGRNKDYQPKGDYSIKDMIAWLEKQDEQKPTDKVEPKFKVGDWVVHDMSDGRKVIRQIVNMTNKSYVLDGEDFNTFYFNDLENDYHLWSINDAKEGDILAIEPIDGYQYPFVAIYKNHGLDFFNSYCFIGFNGIFYGGEEGHSIEDVHPSTKEQRDILFEKMKEAGYEWDTEKKELKKIEQKSQRMISAEAKEAMYDKPALREDEVKINRIVACLENLNVADNDILLKDIDWLKSLKERIE